MAQDLSSMWLSELEMENQGFMNQDDMSECFTDRSIQTLTRFEEQTEMNPLSCDNKASSINTMCQTQKTVAATSLSSSNTFTISFGKQNTKHVPPFDDSIGVEISGTCTGKVQTMARTPVKVQDHVLAERKRREKLNRQLISLSSLLPNLRKVILVSCFD
ncbi:putative myc-type, basic helix-loop-helix (bHLH) domain-containing protein [Helianthus annuus]|uniref:Myc-type, basic helix-loop-helix (BHLH) domain-containing protein n=1 Tax=Helianthus annuus TaxID=4232 RepID=A0A9K3HKQ4_HELAN|nr:transcription factor NAI1 [Helianthus annuus]KAF5780228.1 putative myc-type, basic helix-loop-helix (bHLH) domain-containing protein [Helianthus annuus]KAJ0507414.1 putative transcription factor bHLH family [Helianthus annuus]